MGEAPSEATRGDWPRERESRESRLLSSGGRGLLDRWHRHVDGAYLLGGGVEVASPSLWGEVEMGTKFDKLQEAARAALAALETPGDLTPEEIQWVIEDLDSALQGESNDEATDAA